MTTITIESIQARQAELADAAIRPDHKPEARAAACGKTY